MPSRPDNTAENLRDDEIGVVSYDPTRILIPTDGSATAIEATNVAIGLAKRFGAEVVAVFVDPGHAVEPIEDAIRCRASAWQSVAATGTA
jgi:sugar phosphate isomerase/epimerase